MPVFNSLAIIPNSLIVAHEPIRAVMLYCWVQQ